MVVQPTNTVDRPPAINQEKSVGYSPSRGSFWRRPQQSSAPEIANEAIPTSPEHINNIADLDDENEISFHPRLKNVSTPQENCEVSDPTTPSADETTSPMMMDTTPVANMVTTPVANESLAECVPLPVVNSEVPEKKSEAPVPEVISTSSHTAPLDATANEGSY